jgi:hypothetical protein
MRGAIAPLAHYAFMAWCLVKAQGQLYFTLLYLYLTLPYLTLPYSTLCVASIEIIL